MNNQEAYNQWAATYNSVINRTRDLELKAKQQILQDIRCHTVVELGCGTGKNTAWLLQKATRIIAVDFSESMLAKAKERVQSGKVDFVQADINNDWTFVKEQADVITCSLVLEHIEQLEPVFEKVSAALNEGGHFYIGELHPFKQYSGSKARFEKAGEIVVLECFTHHISEYTGLAVKYGFSLKHLGEWMDGEHAGIPRILTLLFVKN